MKYLKGTILIGKNDIELVADRLMELGITALEINDPRDIDELLSKKGTYEWDYIDQSVMAQKDIEPSISFYAEDDCDGHALCEKVKKEYDLYIEVLDDSDWKDKWKEYFKPAHITDTIVVKPTWEEYEKKTGEKIIEIDPGQAFGTGTHPTTTGCIVLMEKYLKEGMNVLDVGCGSGILAIASGLLGAGDVLGIEIDTQALEVGRENVHLNGLSDKVRVEYGDLTKGVSYKADIVVANLMADLIKMLSKDVPRHLNEGGIYISSGILLELEDEVSEAICSCGFEIIEVYRDERDGGWCAIAARYSKDRK